MTTPARNEAGFTLVELLVVMTTLTVVLGAILSVVGTTTRLSIEDQERAHAIREVQVELDGVVREARGAFRVNPSTTTRLDISVHRDGATRRVVFDCSGAHPTLPGTRRCMRTKTIGAGPTEHVGVTIEAPASGARGDGRNHLIRLNDGFAVRNRGLVP